jgi:hypothetical protein
MAVKIKNVKPKHKGELIIDPQNKIKVSGTVDENSTRVSAELEGGTLPITISPPFVDLNKGETWEFTCGSVTEDNYTLTVTGVNSKSGTGISIITFDAVSRTTSKPPEETRGSELPGSSPRE